MNHEDMKWDLLFLLISIPIFLLPWDKIFTFLLVGIPWPDFPDSLLNFLIILLIPLHVALAVGIVFKIVEERKKKTVKEP